jgi:hypothetical protein
MEWRTSRRGRVRVRWEQAQALAVVSSLNVLFEGDDRAYPLVTPIGALAWRLPLNASAHERETSDRLLGLIAARTGLTLRDISREARDSASRLPSQWPAS